MSDLPPRAAQVAARPAPQSHRPADAARRPGSSPQPSSSAWSLYLARGALTPFIVGLLLIYLLDPAVAWFARHV